MDGLGFGRRFLESTRGQIVVLLRRDPRSVDELARALGLTDNAVRNHLSALERDGVIRQKGLRRGGGAGKPAVLYELHPNAAPFFSKAYQPVLAAIVEVLVDELQPEAAQRMMDVVGRRLAHSVGGRAAGNFATRVDAAADVLRALGGDLVVEHAEQGRVLRASGCPLSAAVAHRPELCRAVETLVAEVAGAPARSCCEHGEQPRCCFRIEAAA